MARNARLSVRPSARLQHLHVPEAFMDTMMVNGTAYPYLVVAPGPYRFRILNACNDRYLNLQLYKNYQQTEVKMVKAVFDKSLNKNYPN